MDISVGETPGDSWLGEPQSPDWVRCVIALLDTAACQLDHKQAARRTILKAASLLRKSTALELAQEAPVSQVGLPGREARKVRAYIDDHISDRILVADLCALVNLSEGHFSRTFLRTFGERPHAYLIRRRVELAAQYMLRSEASLIDIALQCGFADQTHFSKLFRKKTGQAPAAWRRAHNDAAVADKHECGRTSSRDQNEPVSKR